MQLSVSICRKMLTVQPRDSLNMVYTSLLPVLFKSLPVTTAAVLRTPMQVCKAFCRAVSNRRRRYWVWYSLYISIKNKCGNILWTHPLLMNSYPYLSVLCILFYCLVTLCIFSLY